MSTETQIAVREIVAYATKGGKIAKINTDVKTWGELKPLLKREGYDLNSLLAAESINRADLVNDLAVLPEGPFRVFLRPKQTKSGADYLPYKEVRAKVQELIASDGDVAKAHFNEGKNYTTKKGDELNVLLNSYKGGSVTTSSAKAEPKKEAVKTEAPKAEEKASPKASEAQEFSEEGCIKVAVEALSKIKSVNTANVISLVKDLLNENVSAAAPVKKEPTEEELLAEEAKAFMEGY